MSEFPRSPRLTKGAILAIDLTTNETTPVLFQYNPERLTRRLAPQTMGGDATSGRAEPLRIKGPPVETITVELVIDAADQLESAGAGAVAALSGIAPLVTALELLVYPRTQDVLANAALLAAGTMEVVPPEAPLTLFVWGPNRVTPVRITDIAVTEKAFDPLLNPILAEVTLGLRVLSFSDFSVTHPGHGLFLAQQVLKETMATVGRATAAGNALVKSVLPQVIRMFDPSSRYANLETATHVEEDGREVAYKRRRFLPHGSEMPVLAEVAVQQGDRLDLVTARTLGDPEHAWRVADANDAMHPEELTSEPGRRLRVPIPEA